MTSDKAGVCAKVCLIIFNIIYLAIGGGLLGIGIWFSVEGEAFHFDEFTIVANSLLGGRMFDVCFYIFIAFGAFIFLLGIFGLFATVVESPLFLIIYIILVATLFLVEVALGIVAVVYKDDIVDVVDSRLTQLTKEEYYDQESNPWDVTESGKALDIIQTRFLCCGVNTYLEFEPPQSNFSVRYSLQVPYSCCTLKAGRTWEDANRAESLKNPTQCWQYDILSFQEIPCKQAVTEWVEEWSVVLIGTALGVAALQIFGFLFAVCLCTAIRREL